LDCVDLFIDTFIDNWLFLIDFLLDKVFWLLKHLDQIIFLTKHNKFVIKFIIIVEGLSSFLLGGEVFNEIILLLAGVWEELFIELISSLLDLLDEVHNLFFLLICNYLSHIFELVERSVKSILKKHLNLHKLVFGYIDWFHEITLDFIKC